MKLKYRFFTGPTIVDYVAEQLLCAGIDAHAGTEHVYGTIAVDMSDWTCAIPGLYSESFEVKCRAAEKINAAVGWNIVR